MEGIVIDPVEWYLVLKFISVPLLERRKPVDVLWESQAVEKWNKTASSALESLLIEEQTPAMDVCCLFRRICPMFYSWVWVQTQPGQSHATSQVSPPLSAGKTPVLLWTVLLCSSSLFLLSSPFMLRIHTFCTFLNLALISRESQSRK